MARKSVGRSKTVAIRLPQGLYETLVGLAEDEQITPSTMAAQFVANQVRAYAAMHANTKAANLMDWMIDKFTDFEGAPKETPPGARARSGATGSGARVGVLVAPPQEDKNGHKTRNAKTRARG